MTKQSSTPAPGNQDKPNKERPETWQPDQQGGQGGNRPDRPPPPTGQPDQKDPNP